MAKVRKRKQKIRAFAGDAGKKKSAKKKTAKKRARKLRTPIECSISPYSFVVIEQEDDFDPDIRVRLKRSDETLVTLKVDRMLRLCSELLAVCQFAEQRADERRIEVTVDIGGLAETVGELYASMSGAHDEATFGPELQKLLDLVKELESED